MPASAGLNITVKHFSKHRANYLMHCFITIHSKYGELDGKRMHSKHSRQAVHALIWGGDRHRFPQHAFQLRQT